MTSVSNTDVQAAVSFARALVAHGEATLKDKAIVALADQKRGARLSLGEQECVNVAIDWAKNYLDPVASAHDPLKSIDPRMLAQAFMIARRELLS